MRFWSEGCGPLTFFWLQGLLFWKNLIPFNFSLSATQRKALVCDLQDFQNRLCISHRFYITFVIPHLSLFLLGTAAIKEKFSWENPHKAPGAGLPGACLSVSVPAWLLFSETVSRESEGNTQESICPAMNLGSSAYEFCDLEQVAKLCLLNYFCFFIKKKSLNPM